MADDFGLTHLPPLPPVGNAGDSKEHPYTKDIGRKRKGKKNKPGISSGPEGDEEKATPEEKDEPPSGKVLDILI